MRDVIYLVNIRMMIMMIENTNLLVYKNWLSYANSNKIIILYETTCLEKIII